MPSRYYFFILTLAIFTMFISWEYYSTSFNHPDSISVEKFPATIGPWTAQELPLGRVDVSILETKNAFLRRYDSARHGRIYLYIAYSQSNPKAANPPDIFYKDSGFSILDKGKNTIIINPSRPKIKVNWLLLDNDQNQQIVYYWFKVGNLYTHSYWKQQTLSAYNTLTGKRTGTALIRISADIIDGRQNEASKRIDAFASMLGPKLSQYLP